MKKFLAVLAVGLTMALTVGAQAPEPNQGSHIQLFVGVSTLTGSPTVNGNENTVANLFGVEVPFSNRWSARYVQINIPSSDAQFYQGQVSYSRNLAELLNKNGSAHVNLRRLVGTVYGGFGSVRQNGEANPALSVGGKLRVQINETFGVDLIDIGYYRGFRGEGITLSNHVNIAGGIAFRF